MHVTVRKVEDVVIVVLNGSLHCGLDDEILQGVVNELLAEGWKKILLNLSKVTSIDSAGIGELVQSLRLCKKFDADLKLLNLHDRVWKSLHLAQLLPVFHVHDDEKEALKSFEASVGSGR
jgi:anti-sigma B factor antagonist